MRCCRPSVPGCVRKRLPNQLDHAGSVGINFYERGPGECQWEDLLRGFLDFEGSAADVDAVNWSQSRRHGRKGERQHGSQERSLLGMICSVHQAHEIP